MRPWATADDDVADVQGSTVDEHLADHAAPLLHLRLEAHPGPWSVGIGLVLVELRDRQDRVEQLVDARR